MTWKIYRIHLIRAFPTPSLAYALSTRVCGVGTPREPPLLFVSSAPQAAVLTRSIAASQDEGKGHSFLR